MSKVTNEPIADVDPSDNVLQALHERAATSPNAAALLVLDQGTTSTITASEMLARVRSLAAGLVGAGVEVGDRVAIFSHSSAEWALADYAVWQAGATSVTIYETSSPDQVSWILSDSGAVAAIVENDELAAVVESVRDDAPDLGQVFTIADGGLDELEALGTSVVPTELDERAATIAHDHAATIVYTSGTTGRPKGCVVTHLNLIWTIRQITISAPDLIGPGNRTLTFLPLAHILARVVQLASITAGVPVGFGGGIRTLLDDLADLQPTWLTVVPRVLEKVHDGAAQKAGTGIKRKIFDRAADTARKMGAHVVAGTTPPIHLKVEHAIADRLVYGNIRAAMGGELKWVISGGAPLHSDLALFFSGVGVEVLEGYGLTETTGPATVDRPGHAKPGTVGPPLAGVDVKISDQGEILIKGNVVFQGYWQNEGATDEAFVDGYFRTGDYGKIDADGHVVITGRMKDLIVTAGGKNIAPAPLEAAIAAHPIVSHAVVVGDDRPFIAALLTLDMQALGLWANERGRHVNAPGHLIEELSGDPDLHIELQKAVDAANEGVSRAEGVKVFRVLTTDFTVSSGELTPTMKVRRSIVINNHATIVESIYTKK